MQIANEPPRNSRGRAILRLLPLRKDCRGKSAVNNIPRGSYFIGERIAETTVSSPRDEIHRVPSTPPPATVLCPGAPPCLLSSALSFINCESICDFAKSFLLGNPVFSSNDFAVLSPLESKLKYLERSKEEVKSPRGAREPATFSPLGPLVREAV